mmetsp:Transcript_14977/g.24357  ORF Transcript_14977/g.24357 Transcript_14977/m.24357 type:complete len:123 (+) Transcript_14977:556-924(+)
MTNRPPPTQASPFVSTILRPLKEFDTTYASHGWGDNWKRQAISAVSNVPRKRSGWMSDGEKGTLQLYLDHWELKSHVVDGLGVDAEGIGRVDEGGGEFVPEDAAEEGRVVRKRWKRDHPKCI